MSPGKLVGKVIASLISQPIQPRRNSSLDFPPGHWPTKSLAHMRPRAPAHSLSQISRPLLLHKTRDDRLTHFTDPPPNLLSYLPTKMPTHPVTYSPTCLLTCVVRRTLPEHHMTTCVPRCLTTRRVTAVPTHLGLHPFSSSCSCLCICCCGCRCVVLCCCVAVLLWRFDVADVDVDVDAEVVALLLKRSMQVL